MVITAVHFPLEIGSGFLVNVLSLSLIHTGKKHSVVRLTESENRPQNDLTHSFTTLKNVLRPSHSSR